MYVCICVYMSMHVCVYMCVYEYACMCVCVHMSNGVTCVLVCCRRA
jgi:hypothetical protein